MFFKIDNYNQGYVTFENIKEFFGTYFGDEESIRVFFDAVDIDGNGKIHWNEFLSSIINQAIINRPENMQEAFNFFDRDQKGYFTAQDFKTAIGDPYLSFGGVHADFANVIEEAFPGKEQVRYEDLRLFMLKPSDQESSGY